MCINGCNGLERRQVVAQYNVPFYNGHKRRENTLKCMYINGCNGLERGHIVTGCDAWENITVHCFISGLESREMD